MDWLISLFTEESVAHIVLLYSLVIAIGVMLGKIKVFGISLGVTFVLFVGLFVGHFGFKINEEVLHFIREFGLILFVFTIGLQVGPSFFSSFKKGGMQQNLLASSVVLLGVGVTISIYYILAGRVPMSMMVGVLSGAVTNTPGLGAAQEALRQLHEAGQIAEIPQIALGYAVAYPLGVVGIIIAMILIRIIFRISFEKETEKLNSVDENSSKKPERLNLRIQNKSLDGLKMHKIKELIGRNFVVSRLCRDGKFFIPKGDSILLKDDILLVVTAHSDSEAITTFIGESCEIDWKESENQMVSRRILITQSNVNGKTIGSLHFRSTLGVNVTRVNRSGIDLLGTPNLVLQVGDRVMVVGELEAIDKVEKILGNTLKRLNEPHIFTIFIGIFIGILFGSIPVFIPGMPMPVKLGLAGGPLIIAILISRFGYKFKLITFTHQSANLMLREIGISLFLASVGLASGGKFVESVVSCNGLIWITSGFVITILPLLIVGIIGYKFMKINFFTLMGILAGSTTDPPALAYANSTAGNDAPAVSYSTVYPLTMFLRVILAQILILIFA